MAEKSRKDNLERRLFIVPFAHGVEDVRIVTPYRTLYECRDRSEWKRLGEYLYSFDIHRLYLDGMVIGEMGENEDWSIIQKEVEESLELRRRIASGYYEGDREKLAKKKQLLSALSGEQLKAYIKFVARKQFETLLSSGEVKFEIMWNLINKGAKPMKTENVKLSLETARYNQLNYAARYGQLPSSERQELEELEKDAYDRIIKRDWYMAKRINNTLLPGENGVIFYGIIHDVTPYLEEDIKVEELAKPGMKELRKRALQVLKDVQNFRRRQTKY